MASVMVPTEQPGPELPAVDEVADPLDGLRHPAADGLQALDVAVDLHPHRLVAGELQGRTAGEGQRGAGPGRGLGPQHAEQLHRVAQRHVAEAGQREVHVRGLDGGELVGGLGGGRLRLGGDVPAGGVRAAVRAAARQPPHQPAAALGRGGERFVHGLHDPADLVQHLARRHDRCKQAHGSIVAAAVRRQPPIADIGRSGCRNVGSSMPWPGRLLSHRRPPAVGDLVVVGAAAQRRPQVGLLAGEQAVADLAVGGQPDPVAVAAERPRHRRDHARPWPGRRRPGTARRARSPAAPRPASSVNSGPQRLEDLVGGDHRVAAPAVLGVERHLLDEPQLVAVVEAPAAAARAPGRR